LTVVSHAHIIITSIIMDDISPSEKIGKSTDKEYLFFLKAAFYIVSVCIICEVFVFNARHFVTHWGDGQINMQNAEYQLINMVRNEQAALFEPTEGESHQILFPNINKRVVTVYIDAVFNNDEFAKMQGFYINYGNEEDSNRTTAVFNLIRGVEESKYVTLQTSGKVSHVRLIYGEQQPIAAIRGVTLNKPVPLKIFWPRLLLFSIAAFCIVVIKHKKLFSLPLRNNSKGQNILTVSIMAAFTVYLFVLMLFTLPVSRKIPFTKNFARDPGDQYSTEIVDAILDGHAYLNVEPTKEFLALKNPYDFTERREAGMYPPNDPTWDHVYYNGKYYSYFGIVQVLVLALPYKLITGRYIPTRIAVFIFSALASVFLMLIWRCLVFRYMKNMPLGIYALGQIAIAMCSLVTFLVTMPRFYEAAVASALFFTTLGIWLVLGSSKDDKINKVSLALGCLCMALAVGCRPTSMFYLPLIPFLVFKHFREAWSNKKRFFILCAWVAAPCIIVACGLMWYNFIRFGSVFQFATDYQVSGQFVKGYHSLNPLGKIFKAVVIVFCYLVPSFYVSTSFPFVFLSGINNDLAFKGYMYGTPLVGLLALPVIWSLFVVGVFRKTFDGQSRSVFHLCIAMICLGLIQILFLSSNSAGAGFVTRYSADFFWPFVFSGLISSYLIWNSTKETCLYSAQLPNKAQANLSDLVLIIFCVRIIISVALLFLLTIGSGEHGGQIMSVNPEFVFSIQRLLGFNTW